MLSVLIHAGEGDEERLARTLASLVPAAVEGVVREAIVIAAGPASAVASVADHAGCRVVTSIPDAIRAAKGEWLLLLEAGARLREGWSESVLAHVADNGGPARLTPDGSGWNALKNAFRLKKRPLAQGLLIKQREAASLPMTGSPGHERLGRRLRLRKLDGRIVPA